MAWISVIISRLVKPARMQLTRLSHLLASERPATLNITDVLREELHSILGRDHLLPSGESTSAESSQARTLLANRETLPPATNLPSELKKWLASPLGPHGGEP